MLVELNRSFVRLRFLARSERAQISSLPAFRIFLPRVQAILAGFQFTDHTSTRLLVSLMPLFEYGSP